MYFNRIRMKNRKAAGALRIKRIRSTGSIGSLPIRTPLEQNGTSGHKNRHDGRRLLGQGLGSKIFVWMVCSVFGGCFSEVLLRYERLPFASQLG